MMFAGITLGLFTLVMIGFGFVWVIGMEYHLGYLWWPYPLAIGILIIIGSLFVSNAGWSALLGIAGGVFIWGSTELRDQAVRAELGWFKFNHKPRPNPPGVRWIKRIKAPHL
jgi:hypothetical protein